MAYDILNSENELSGAYGFDILEPETTTADSGKEDKFIPLTQESFRAYELQSPGWPEAAKAGMRPGTELTTALTTGLPQDIGKARELVSEGIRQTFNVPTHVANIVRGKEPGDYGYVEPASPEAYAEKMDFLSTSVLPLKRTEIAPEESWLTATPKAAWNLGKDVYNFLSSPLGIATLGLGTVEGAGAKVLSRVFLADMASSLAQQAPEIASNWGNMTEAQKAEALTQFAGTAAMTGLLAKHGLKSEAKPSAKPTVTEPVREAPTQPAVFERAQPVEEVPSPKPTPEAQPQAAIAIAPEKPPVAKMGPQSEFKNTFGDPRGTSYHATPEDWAEWQSLASKNKMEQGVWQRLEALKNKYGQTVPEPPIEQPAMQGGVSTAGQALEPLTSTTTLTPKSQRQIITDLSKGLSVPIRFGRLQTSKFAGYFLPKAKLIASKRANDLPVVSHEVGHRLDSEFKLSDNPALRAELEALGDPSVPGSRSSWTPSKTAKYKLGEGMAEFVRHWMTDAPNAKKLAPKLYDAFETILDSNKDFGDVLRQARDDIQTWRNAEPQARLRSHISVGDNPNKTRYTVSQLTRDLVDDLHFLRLAVDDAQTLSQSKLRPSDNPYLLARNMRGSYGMASTFIQQGIVDFKNKSVQLGTSLEDALKPVADSLSDFRDWIVAKRAQELHARGKETGLVKADVDTVANRFNSNATFQSAFDAIKKWNDSLLQYAVDSGMVTEDAAKAIRSLNQDFVPFHRVFEVGAGEASALESAGIGRGLNVGKPGSLRGIKGSTRDIVDPFETMIKNAYTIVTASEKAAINKAVADLSNLPGMGKWIERVSIPKTTMRVGLEKVRKQLENHGADLTDVPDELLLHFFQNRSNPAFGENTIRVIRDGKPEFYRLKRELFETFHALDMEDSGTLIRMLSAPAQVLRAGVTLAPDFALSNMLRDTMSAGILSKYGAFPFHVTLKGIAAYFKHPELVAEWAASGGRSAVEASYFDRAKLQSFLADKIKKELSPSERALIVLKNPMVALRWLSSVSEEATRLGEYKTALEALQKQGMSAGDARRLAAFEARDRQDFAKGGAKTKILRHASAFWNAGLQANVKLAQAFKERPLEITLKGLAYITIPKLLEQGLNWNDDDYWDRPQWERDLFFLIPIGKGDDGHTQFLRIPVPFELGVIFGTIPGRFMDWARNNKAETLTTIPSMVAQQTIPNPIPQTLQTVFADFLSGKKGWDVWRGRTVVPESIANLPPDLQWTSQTSLTAKKLGKMLNFSPVKIDHIVNSTTGGVGKQITHNVVDRAISAATGEPRTATGYVPGGRFVTSPANVSSEALNRFYDVLDLLRTDYARAQQLGTVNRTEDFRKQFESLAREFTKINQEIQSTDSKEEQRRLREIKLARAREIMKLYDRMRR